MNAVRWVPERHEGEEVIVSGGVDCSVRIWKETKGEVSLLQDLNDQSLHHVKSLMITLDQQIALQYFTVY